MLQQVEPLQINKLLRDMELAVGSNLLEIYFRPVGAKNVPKTMDWLVTAPLNAKRKAWRVS